MKETFGQRLQRLRKEKGLTQEDIANKINISPQAVSKWENDISTPDIYILDELANILDVTVDELLGRESPKQEEKTEFVESEVVDDKEEKKKGDRVVFNNEGIHVESEDGNQVDINSHGIYVNNQKKEFVKEYKAEGIISGILWGLAVIGYILMGIIWTDQTMGWKSGWILFLLPPVITSIFSAIRHKRFCNFVYPVAVTAAYCALGFAGDYFGFNGWNFYWFLFITIPAYYMIFGPVDRIIHRNDYKEFVYSDDNDDDEDDDD